MNTTSMNFTFGDVQTAPRVLMGEDHLGGVNASTYNANRAHESMFGKNHTENHTAEGQVRIDKAIEYAKNVHSGDGNLDNYWDTFGDVADMDPDLYAAMKSAETENENAPLSARPKLFEDNMAKINSILSRQMSASKSFNSNNSNIYNNLGGDVIFGSSDLNDSDSSNGSIYYLIIAVFLYGMKVMGNNMQAVSAQQSASFNDSTSVTNMINDLTKLPTLPYQLYYKDGTKAGTIDNIFQLMQFAEFPSSYVCKDPGHVGETYQPDANLDGQMDLFKNLLKSVKIGGTNMTALDLYMNGAGGIGPGMQPEQFDDYITTGMSTFNGMLSNKYGCDALPDFTIDNSTGPTNGQLTLDSNTVNGMKSACTNASQQVNSISQQLSANMQAMQPGYNYYISASEDAVNNNKSALQSMFR